MLKYLLLALIVIWLVYSPALRRQINTPGKPKGAKPSPADQPKMMLTCAHCGIHFPQDDAYPQGAQAQGPRFCCAEHWRAGPVKN